MEAPELTPEQKKRQYYLTHLAERRSYYQANKQRLLEYQKEYSKKNELKIKNYQTSYYQKVLQGLRGHTTPVKKPPRCVDITNKRKPVEGEGAIETIMMKSAPIYSPIKVGIQTGAFTISFN